MTCKKFFTPSRSESDYVVTESVMHFAVLAFNTARRCLLSAARWMLYYPSMCLVGTTS